MPEPVTTMVAGSTLAYLTAELVVDAAAGPRFGGRTRIPCSAASLNSRNLAADMFAVAFWGLQQQGALALRLVEATYLRFIRKTRVGITQLSHRYCSGLEGAIMASVKAEGPDDVKAVIRRWFESDRSDPDAYVIQVAEQEAVDQGLMRRTEIQRGAVARLILGGTRLDPDCARIEALHARARDLASGWRRFLQEDPLLCQALRRECRSAIGSRQESSD
jgi:hypothetical protein